MARKKTAHKPNSLKTDLELWQPFLRPGKYLSDDFLKIADDWLFLVSAYGISKTPSQPTTKAEFLTFLAHCHDGWKLAQIQIAAFLTQALAKRQAIMNEKKQHSNKNSEDKKQARIKINKINLEIRVARRMLDVILWTIFGCEHSTLRRLTVKGGQHSLSAENIAVAMDTANYLNKNALVMALSTDMLSSVHVGDLVVVNHENNVGIEFVELKTGKKNAAISSTAEFAVQSECKIFENLATANYNETDKKHYARVKNQLKRNEMILSTIRNEGGIDPNTGDKIIINSITDPIEYWSDRITQCYQSLSDQKTWAIGVVDECIYFGVYTDQPIAFVGFKSWMDSMGCMSQIFNLTDSFYDSSVRPLGATLLPLELKHKVLRGEIIVVMCLDILKFIDLANKIQPDYMRFTTKSETAKINKSHRLRKTSLSLDGQFIHTTIGGMTGFIGIGTRDRLLFDQQRPLQLLSQRIKVNQMKQNDYQKLK